MQLFSACVDVSILISIGIDLVLALGDFSTSIFIAAAPVEILTNSELSILLPSNSFLLGEPQKGFSRSVDEAGLELSICCGHSDCGQMDSQSGLCFPDGQG